jgi:hypothetical protein
MASVAGGVFARPQTRALHQARHFVAGQITVFAHAQVGVADRSNSNAAQADDRVAYGLAHIADLPGPAFVQHHGEQRLILAGAQACLA